MPCFCEINFEISDMNILCLRSFENLLIPSFMFENTQLREKKFVKLNLTK